MIAVLDYGIGNLRSAEKALQHVGGDARLITASEEAIGAEGIVLPGVGAFGACAEALAGSGLEPVVRAAIGAGVPFLGVCVGFQLLFEDAEESPGTPGLGILQGSVRRLSGSVKLPQIQWNTLTRTGAPSAMLAGLGEAPWFYFVHSYAPVPAGEDVEHVVATCDYGGEVVAAMEKGVLWGCQFHPEKSGATGLALLANFVAATRQAARPLEALALGEAAKAAK
ncbi:MAG: imidazole glycerol phosphate synthase subunit HisH [Actinomycetota bacterium]|nr:imidazole glycerol phosphate synthase subunit HisH [Actinomycetota bacterium]